MSCIDSVELWQNLSWGFLSQPTSFQPFSATYHNNAGPPELSHLSGRDKVAPGLIIGAPCSWLYGRVRRPPEEVKWREAGGGAEVFRSPALPPFITTTYANECRVSLRPADSRATAFAPDLQWARPSFRIQSFRDASYSCTSLLYQVCLFFCLFFLFFAHLPKGELSWRFGPRASCVVSSPLDLALTKQLTRVIPLGRDRDGGLRRGMGWGCGGVM